MEPQTSAKVVLHTTKGPIEIELWAKETPLASRNFLQLCADGYYDNCSFHRIVKDFVVQAGDPSGTGFGGSAIYESGSFKDEFTTRLRFNRRGLLGCANAGTRDSNGSQFIITLAPTPELNNKNTLFGRVEGDTIFNVLKIAEAALDENDRPLYPAHIERAEIVVPYFHDLKIGTKKEEAPKVVKTKKKVKSKVRISYDDDEEPEIAVKLKPAHDLLKDKRLGGNAEVTGRADRSEKSEKTGTTDLKRKPVPADTDAHTDTPKKPRTEASVKPTPLESQPTQSEASSQASSQREALTLKMLEKFQAKLPRFATIDDSSEEEVLSD